MDWIKSLDQYGFAGVVTGIVFFILWKMIVWMMAFIKDDRKQQSEERQIYASRLEKLNDAMDKTVNNIVEHDRRADERGRYVREEHKQMIETLARINGYKNNQ